MPSDIFEQLNPETEPETKTNKSDLFDQINPDQGGDIFDRLNPSKPASAAPEQTTAGGALARAAVKGAIPSGAFAAAAGPTFGAVLPWATGLAAPLGPLAPLAGAGIAGVASVGAGMLASKAAGAVQGAAAEAIAPETTKRFGELEQADAAQHPGAQFVGELASGLPSMRLAPGTVLRGARLVPRVLAGSATAAEKELVGKAGGRLVGGAAFGAVTPLLEGRLPTWHDVLSGAAFTSIYGEPYWSKGHGAPVVERGQEAPPKEEAPPPPAPDPAKVWQTRAEELAAKDNLSKEEEGELSALDKLIEKQKKGTSTETTSAPAPGTGASVPLLITREMHQALADLGYGTADRDAMKPEEAQAVLAEGKRKPVADHSQHLQTEDGTPMLRPVVQWQGRKFYGNTHQEAIELARAKGYDILDDNEQFRGFETADGRFVDRKEAAQIYEQATGHKLEAPEGMHSQDLLAAGLKAQPKGPQLLESEQQRAAHGSPPEANFPWQWQAQRLVGRRVRNRQTGQEGVAVGAGSSGRKVEVMLVDGSKDSWLTNEIDPNALHKLYPGLAEATGPITTTTDKPTKGKGKGGKLTMAEQEKEKDKASQKTLEGTQDLLSAIHESGGLKASSILEYDPEFPTTLPKLRIAIRNGSLPAVWEKLVKWGGGGLALDEVPGNVAHAFGNRYEGMKPDQMLNEIHREARVREHGVERLSHEQQLLADEEKAELAKSAQRALDEMRQEELQKAASDNGLDDVPVNLVDEFSEPDHNAPFGGSMALPIKGRIEIRKADYRRWLRLARDPAMRQQMIASLVSEEAFHVRALKAIGNEGAAQYWQQLSGAERWLVERMYRYLPIKARKGKLMEFMGPLTESQLGHEAIRFRLQQLARLTPREIAQLSGLERWSMQALQLLGRVIGGLRNTFGGKEGKALLARVQSGINAAMQSGGDLPAARSLGQGGMSRINQERKFAESGVVEHFKQRLLNHLIDHEADSEGFDIDTMVEIEKGLRSYPDLRKIDPAVKPMVSTAVRIDPTLLTLARTVNRVEPVMPEPNLPEADLPAAFGFGRDPQDELFLPPVEAVRERTAPLVPPRLQQEGKVEQGKLGLKMNASRALVSGLANKHLDEAVRPNFQEFADEVDNKFPGVQTGTLAEIWQEALRNRIEILEQGQHDSMVDKLASMLGVKSNLGFKIGKGLSRTGFKKGESNAFLRTKLGEGGKLAREGEVPFEEGEAERTRKDAGLDEAQAKEEEHEGATVLRTRPRDLLRRNLLSAIWEKLAGESTKPTKGFRRAEVKLDEIRYGTYERVTEAETKDPEFLGRLLTEGGGLDKTTSQTVGRGKDKVTIKRKAPPIAATRSLVLLADRRTGQLELVSAYSYFEKTEKGQPKERRTMLVDPGLHGDEKPHIPLELALHRYRPVARMQVDEPISHFRQSFKDIGEWNREMGSTLDQDRQTMESARHAAEEEVFGAEQGHVPEDADESVTRALRKSQADELPKQRKGEIEDRPGRRDLTPDEANLLVGAAHDELGKVTEASDLSDVLLQAIQSRGSKYAKERATGGARLVNAWRKVMRRRWEMSPDLQERMEKAIVANDQAEIDAVNAKWYVETVHLIHDQHTLLPDSEVFVKWLNGWMGQKEAGPGTEGVAAGAGRDPGGVQSGARDLTMRERPRTAAEQRGYVPPKGPGPEPRVTAPSEQRVLDAEDLQRMVEETKKRFTGEQQELAPSIYQGVPAIGGPAKGVTQYPGGQRVGIGRIGRERGDVVTPLIGRLSRSSREGIGPRLPKAAVEPGEVPREVYSKLGVKERADLTVLRDAVERFLESIDHPEAPSQRTGPIETKAQAPIEGTQPELMQHQAPPSSSKPIRGTQPELFRHEEPPPVEPFEAAQMDLPDMDEFFRKRWNWKGTGPGKNYEDFKREQSRTARPVPRSTDAAVKAAILEAKKNGPSPEFRALFGGIDPALTGTTAEKVAAFAKTLGLEYREVPKPEGEAPAAFSVGDDEVQFMNTAEPRSNLSYYQAAYMLAEQYKDQVPDGPSFIDAIGMSPPKVRPGPAGSRPVAPKYSPVLMKAWADVKAGRPMETDANALWTTAQAGASEYRPRRNENRTVVMGSDPDEVFGRPKASQAADALALAQTHKAIEAVDTGLPAGEQLSDVAQPNLGFGGVEFVPDGFNRDPAGRKLIEVLQTLAANPSAGAPYLFTSLINSIRINHRLGRFSDKADGQPLFSQPIADKLYSLTQSEASHRGLMLQSLQRFGDNITAVGRDVATYLRREWRSEIWGDQAHTIEGLFDRVMERLTNFLPQNAADALSSQPEVQAFIDRVIDEQRQFAGNRVFQRFQRLMRPKARKKLESMLLDQRVADAVQSLIEQAEKAGLQPKKPPGKSKLSPKEALLYLTSDVARGKVSAMMDLAIWQGERNAARSQVEGRLDADEMALYDERTKKGATEPGPDPTRDEIDNGLKTAEWKHWKEVFAPYDPVTVKLVQQVLKGDFKGTKFDPATMKKADTRIDLERLAKSPDAEVGRAFDAYIEDLTSGMDWIGASAATRDHVGNMVRGALADQLEAARARVRDPMFVEKIKSGAPLTADERVLELLHAKLFADPRADLPGMVERLAGKAPIKGLMPKLSDLIHDIFSTPFFRQDELRANFVSALTERLGVEEAQAGQAWDVFNQAFFNRFGEAKERALKEAIDSLTPKERKVIPKDLYAKIARAHRAGLFDSGAILQDIAKSRGYRVPSEGEVAKIRNLVDREERLRQIPEKQRKELEASGASEADMEKTRVEHEDATREQRDQIKKELERLWASLRYPFALPKFKDVDSWKGAWAQKRNYYRAAHEMATLGLIAKVGFPFRIFTHLTTQLVGHALLRPLARAEALWKADKLNGKPHDLIGDIISAYADGFSGWGKALRPTLSAMRAELSGRGELRNVDRLLTGVNGLERMAEQAREHMANWKATKNPLEYAKGFLLHIYSAPRLMGWVISATDSWQGVPAEYQDILHQVEISARENGMDKAESATLRENMFKDLRTEFVTATADAKRLLSEHPEGAPPTPEEISKAAWNLVLRRAYDKIERAGLPAGDIESSNAALRRSLAWQEEVKRGVGGLVGGKLVRALPLTWGAFANAIGHSINYAFMWMPPPFHWLAEHPALGQKEHSGWYATDLDRKQRTIQSLVGTAVGGYLAYLVFNGALRVIPHFIPNKDDRDKLEKAGHKPGTVEVVLPDGSFIPFSMVVGPWQPMAPYLAAAGAAFDLGQKRVAAQQKLNERAARLGLPAGKIEPPSVTDYGLIAAAAGFQTLLGSKTAGGWSQQFLEPGRLEANVKRTAAQFIQPFIPGAPAWNEIARMDGVALEKHLASFWDYLVPLPTSQARALNVFGDPVGTPNGVQRVIQVISSGTYPAVVDPKEMAEGNAAYAAMESSGYRPPAIIPGRAYNVNGTLRPLTDEELVTYTAKRGELLKAGMAALGSGATVEGARAAFQAADEGALGSVGAETARQTAKEAGQKTGMAARKAALPVVRTGRGGRTGKLAATGRRATRLGAGQAFGARGRVTGGRRSRLARGKISL